MAAGASMSGVAEVNAVLAMIRTTHLNMAKKELRDGSQKIAQDVLIPELKRGATRSGVPIAPAMADTARARKDRMVFVRVGAVNPRLSGFKTRRGGTNYKTNLALGSNYGPLAGSPQNYGIPRTPAGAWVQPTVNSNGTYAKVKDAYRDLLAHILGKYGRRF